MLSTVYAQQLSDFKAEIESYERKISELQSQTSTPEATPLTSPQPTPTPTPTLILTPSPSSLPAAPTSESTQNPTIEPLPIPAKEDNMQGNIVLMTLILIASIILIMSYFVVRNHRKKVN